MEHLTDDHGHVEVLDLLAGQTALLLDDVARLTDDDTRSPSRLPGWSRGHVLTHLSRNADGLAGVLTSAAEGRPASMYPSWAARDADIEAGAGRPAAELVADLRTSAETLARTLDALPEAGFDVTFTSPAGWWRPVRDIPWYRCREVVLHHVDLGTGFTLDDVPVVASRLVGETVPLFEAKDGAPGLELVATDSGLTWRVHGGGQRVTGTVVELAGWLTGRTDGTGLRSDQALPPLPSWP